MPVRALGMEARELGGPRVHARIDGFDLRSIGSGLSSCC